MEKIFIKDLKQGEPVTSFFLVQQKEISKKRNDEDYLRLIVSDRTGFVNAVMWDNVEEIRDSFQKDDIVKIQGVSTIYQDNMQIVIRRLRLAAEDEIDLKDYLPSSLLSKDELISKLQAEIAEVETPSLKFLLENIFSDKDIMDKFATAPAGQSLHHVYIGGLLEHTLSMLTISKFLADHLGKVDRDLIIAGALLHDIGKIRELRFARSFGYTDEGRLLGHILIGLEIVKTKIDEIEQFPEDLRIKLEHLILSHHGQYEWGSPKLPMTLEALILHYSDDVDAKFNTFVRWIEQNPDLSNPEWTRYFKQLERYIYTGNKESEL
ncbi:MAG: hypothetical protein A2161_22685 [Candidatus Schekmanbacteria bacterium RBG_13_48_7]|uniref:HD domain-containing protein n=1 Tax=Candidatus Schekmanbacteria bacterium RBG_13_48_7 TaxID=1817878 RepID=A0A1F7S233_9BACT|nr:MAG: hypothetical protein A2161_22685 [Candidatus Schekmanbacteria bacterium RBG_13_48_7]